MNEEQEKLLKNLGEDISSRLLSLEELEAVKMKMEGFLGEGEDVTLWRTHIEVVKGYMLALKFMEGKQST